MHENNKPPGGINRESTYHFLLVHTVSTMDKHGGAKNTFPNIAKNAILPTDLDDGEIGGSCIHLVKSLVTKIV